MFLKAGIASKRSVEREQTSFAVKLGRQQSPKLPPLFSLPQPKHLNRLTPLDGRRTPGVSSSKVQSTPLVCQSQESFASQNFKRLKALVSPDRKEATSYRRDSGRQRSPEQKLFPSGQLRVRTELSEHSQFPTYHLTSYTGESAQHFFPANQLPELPSEETHKKGRRSGPTMAPLEETSSSGSEEEATKGRQSPPRTSLKATGDQPNVRMTASFNVMSVDSIEEYEQQVERTVNKLRKIFSATASIFNKQQLAFILHSLGWVDELDDDFSPKSPEDALFLNIFYAAQKSKIGGVRLKTLKRSLAMLNSLQTNKVFVREARQRVSKSPRAQKTSLSNRQQSPNALTSHGSNEVNRLRLTEPRPELSSPRETQPANLTIEEIFNERQPSDRDIHFSFKKAQRGVQEGTVSDAHLIQELQQSNGLNLNNIAEHQSLLLESKDPSRLAKALLGRGRSDNSLSQEMAHQPTSGLLSPEKSLKSRLLVEERDPKRGRFLFSNTIVCNGKSHMVKVYENDNLKEQAIKFARDHGADSEKCLLTFGKIEAQRQSFIKNFQIAE